MTKTIAIVEDERPIAEMIARTLEEHGFKVECYGAGEPFLAALQRKAPNLCVMDLGLPDMDGRELCRLMRKHGVKAPVIMLTAQDSDADTILGLEAGANDYVTKPFKVAILLARIRAQLRQHEQSDDAVFTIGPYSFKPAAKILLDEARNRKIRLTEKETAILKYLYRAGDRMVKRETLLNEVWGYNAGVTTHTLETHVYRLRQKIEPDPQRASILVTDSGGYRLVP
jgi:DNA-binding response OmpR family regulator